LFTKDCTPVYSNKTNRPYKQLTPYIIKYATDPSSIEKDFFSINRDEKGHQTKFTNEELFKIGNTSEILEILKKHSDSKLPYDENISFIHEIMMYKDYYEALINQM
jgi:hypothetical protein